MLAEICRLFIIVFSSRFAFVAMKAADFVDLSPALGNAEKDLKKRPNAEKVQQKGQCQVCVCKHTFEHSGCHINISACTSCILRSPPCCQEKPSNVVTRPDFELGLDMHSVHSHAFMCSIDRAF